MALSESRPEVRALLSDIKEHPLEDGLRLVLADWLEENGGPVDQARAELIRCQIEFDRLGPESPQRARCGRLARELQQKHGIAWLGPLAGWTRAWVCQRGLLSINLPVGQLRSQGLAALADSEAWAWVEEVYIAGAHEQDIARLRHCVLLDSILSLGFHQGDIGPAGAQALSELPLLAHLVRLDLRHQGIGDTGLVSLLGSGRLRRLHSLELPNTQLTAAGATALAAAGLGGLRSLILWGNQLGDAGVRLLTGNASAGLVLLDLRGNRIGDAGARALASAAALAPLRHLILSENEIGPGGAAALARSPHLGGLASLVLWGNPVGVEGARLLQERFGPRVHVTSLPA